jgi:hypothetical protein
MEKSTNVSDIALRNVFIEALYGFLKLAATLFSVWPF